jgi:hypothetical protein
MTKSWWNWTGGLIINCEWPPKLTEKLRIELLLFHPWEKNLTFGSISLSQHGVKGETELIAVESENNVAVWEKIQQFSWNVKKGGSSQKLV